MASSASSLPSNFLSNPSPNITIKKIDFTKTPIPQYDGLKAFIIDNALSKPECETLVQAAEATTNSIWEQAMVNVGMGKQKLMKDVRDCGRIIWDSQTVVDAIWSRVKALVLPEMEVLKNVPKITGPGPAKRRETWKLTRPNERMRFLRYGVGQYFKPHKDGSYVTPDGSEISFYTLHLYLNESDPDSTEGKLEGGATVFHYYDMDVEKNFKVAPKIGRILIFQHKHLLHSGEDVTAGIKMTLRTDLMYKKVVE